MPRRRVSKVLLCLLVFASHAAQAAPAVEDSKNELKKAGAILSKLRRLEEASRAGSHDSFEKAARKLYPDIFRKVSALVEGELKTEVATAVALYDSASRAGRRGAGGAADCARELRESYVRLCREARGADRAALLRAKARLHASRAGALLLYARGDRDPATLDAVAVARAERGTDRALAADALLSLKELLGEAVDVREAGPAERLASRLEAIDRVLVALPRDRAQQLLRGARDAFRDGLHWRLKAAHALSPFVDASAFTPRGELPRLGLRADDASRAAQANLRAALRLIHDAEEELRQGR